MGSTDYYGNGRITDYQRVLRSLKNCGSLIVLGVISLNGQVGEISEIVGVEGHTKDGCVESLALSFKYRTGMFPGYSIWLNDICQAPVILDHLGQHYAYLPSTSKPI